MLRFLHLSLGLLLGAFSAIAQTYPNPNTISKDSSLIVGEALLAKGVALTETHLDSSLYYKKAALPYFEAATNWEGYVKCLNNIAFIYYYQGNYEDSNAQATLAYQKATEHLEEDDLNYSDAVNNLSVFLMQKGDYDQALVLYEKSLDIQKRMGADQAAIAASYHNLGQAHRRKGDFDEAIHYYQQALELRLDTFGYEHIEVARNYLVLGNSFREKNQLDKALDHYHQVLTIANRPGIAQGKRTTQVKINTYQNIASIHAENLQLDSTNHYIQQALDLQVEEKAYRKSRSYDVLGNLYFEKGQYQQAIELLKQAKDFSLKEYQAYEKHNVFAKFSRQIGEAYASLNDYPNALNYFQKALTEIAADFSAKDISQNPSLDNILYKRDALPILIAKADALYQLHHQTPNQSKQLQSAYQTYQFAAEVIQYLRENILATESKYLLAQRALPVYEKAIRTAFELHETTQQKTYLEEAFTYAESNKAVLLLAVLRDNMAKGFGGIPDSLLLLEKDLKLKLSFYEKQIGKTKGKNRAKDAEKLKNWTETRFNLREQYKRLVKSFEQDYPKYFQVKYDDALIQTSQLQAQLDPQTLAIEYFVGEKDIYIFGISQTAIQLIKKANTPELLEHVTQLRAYISNPPSTENAKEKLNTFTDQSYALYQQLLSPVLSQASQDIQQLLIIPDDFLSYIPYDLLLTKSPDQLIKVLELETAYLLQNYAVTYHYSASLLLNKQEVEPSSNRATFAGFAPSFGASKTADSRAVRVCTDDDLYSLACNDSEVDAIQRLLKGDGFFRKKSSKTAFESIVSDYQIIHLATHACVDEDNPMLSKIYFSDDHLSNYDLYNLDLKADLAVLSACNTGAGRLVKGEGVMSLARGFIQAGCPSVLMSLWSVDDCATSDIMFKFYEELVEGQTKDEALRQAKLSYLAAADRLHLHPYYWSAFVQFGDHQALTFHYGWGGKWPLILGFGVIILMLIWWRWGS